MPPIEDIHRHHHRHHPKDDQLAAAAGDDISAVYEDTVPTTATAAATGTTATDSSGVTGPAVGFGESLASAASKAMNTIFGAMGPGPGPSAPDQGYAPNEPRDTERIVERPANELDRATVAVEHPPADIFRVENWRWITLSAIVGVLAVISLSRAPFLGGPGSGGVMAPDYGAGTLPPAVADFAACLTRTVPLVGEVEAEVQCHQQLAQTAHQRPPSPSATGTAANPLLSGSGAAVPPGSPMMPRAAGAPASMQLMSRGGAKIFAAVIAGFFGVMIANFNTPMVVHQMLTASGVLWFVASIAGSLSVIIWPYMTDSLLYVWVFTTSFWVSLAVYTKALFQYNLPRPLATALSVAACTLLALVIRFTLIF